MIRALPLALAVSLLSLAPTTARADLEDWSNLPEFRPSPERFGLELRPFGIHQPNLGSAFDDFFGGDLGPLLSLNIDYYAFRIPFVGLVGVGVSAGWTHYGGLAVIGSGTASDQSTTLELAPLEAHLVVRIDVLARELNIPLVLSGKVGPDLIYWGMGPFRDSNENLSDGIDGWSLGLRLAAQAALELDFLSPRDARRLDGDWGINHTTLFAEVYYSFAGEFANDQLPVGGLGFVMGLGVTF